MQNLFQSHPYSTRVGTLIERVTDSGKLAIDWTLVLEICDALSETDEGPKEAIRAIRKRLTSSAGKDHVSIWYTLILIESCLKNCGRRFQAQVANRDFLHDLIKVLLPKHSPPIQLQSKILFLIKSWVDAAWDVPGRRDLEKVYTALRRKGVQFPSSAECQSLPPPPPTMTVKRPSSSNPAFSRSTKLSSTFRRLANGALGGDSRFKVHSTASHHRGEDIRRHHQHHRLPQTSSTSQLQRAVSSAESPVTVRALDGSHQLGVRQGEPIPQVLQVVAVNGYPVATRSGQDVIIATSAHPSLNQLQHHQQRCCSQPHLQPSHASVPAGIYTSGGDRTLIDQEGTVRRLSSAQRERLSQDLAVVQTNLHILNDMLTELQPDAISSDDLELLQDLHGTCRMMQQRVADFLSQVADDAVTLTLIQLNDELNSAFQRYERFERYRLRAMRARVANREALVNISHPALPPTQSMPPQLSLPSSRTAGALEFTASSSMVKDDDDNHNEDVNDNDDDDEALLDAVAEQTQRTPTVSQQNASGCTELVSVADWSDNALGLQSLRLNDTSHATRSDPNVAQLERVFGAGFSGLTTTPIEPQVSHQPLRSAAHPQLEEPLQPEPVPSSLSKSLPQQPIKKRTPSEVRRLEEALLLFDS